MLSGVQTGNGPQHDKYNKRGIAHASTNRKDDIFMQRRLYIDEAHMALDIFRFAVFLLLFLSPAPICPKIFPFFRYDASPNTFYLKQGLIGVSPTTKRKPTRRMKKTAEMR